MFMADYVKVDVPIKWDGIKMQDLRDFVEATDDLPEDHVVTVGTVSIWTEVPR